ncbi:MAG: NUDIX domain-containing protein [Thermoactinospora sp.]|nr:NUDIX domain-containing protein [Thermoactinospora sp.]
MAGVPPENLPLIERDAVRVVVIDSADRILLFHTRDPTMPEKGQWWELPGGGIDPGESPAETAVRELREETGIVVSPEQVSAPSWRRDASFRYRGTLRLQHEVVVAVRLGVPGPPVDGGGRVEFEDEDYFGFRWWPVDEVVGSTELFYPRELPRLLGAFLAGEQIDQPFELWS